jgi:hypothetical protein
LEISLGNIVGPHLERKKKEQKTERRKREGKREGGKEGRDTILNIILSNNNANQYCKIGTVCVCMRGY